MVKTDGVSLATLYLENKNAQYTILYSHGNGEDIGDLRDIYQLYYRNGYSVFAWDYRGYGGSTGRSSETKVYRDIETIYEYMTGSLKIPPQKIIALGRSIGSAPAIHLAKDKKVAALITESAIASAYSAFPGIPIFPFDKYRNIDKIEDVICPKLFVHGEKDRIVRIKNSKKLYEKANHPKLKLWHQGSAHNDLLYIFDEKYWQQLKALTRLVEGGSSISPKVSREANRP